MQKMVYLACPYSKDPDYGFTWATIMTAQLLTRHPDWSIFSPVTQGHYVANYLRDDLRLNSDFWFNQYLPFLAKSDLMVLCSPGDDKGLIQDSHGCQVEIEYAKNNGIEILWYERGTLQKW